MHEFSTSAAITSFSTEPYPSTASPIMTRSARREAKDDPSQTIAGASSSSLPREVTLPETDPAVETMPLSINALKKKGSTFKCESCSKVYRHPSCLVKHRWEHSPHWREASKFFLSKHQQVQMLEAAAIMSSIAPPRAAIEEGVNQELGVPQSFDEVAKLSLGTSLPDDRSLWPFLVSGGQTVSIIGTRAPVRKGAVESGYGSESREQDTNPYGSDVSEDEDGDEEAGEPEAVKRDEDANEQDQQARKTIGGTAIDDESEDVDIEGSSTSAGDDFKALPSDHDNTFLAAPYIGRDASYLGAAVNEDSRTRSRSRSGSSFTGLRPRSLSRSEASNLGATRPSATFNRPLPYPIPTSSSNRSHHRNLSSSSSASPMLTAAQGVTRNGSRSRSQTVTSPPPSSYHPPAMSLVSPYASGIPLPSGGSPSSFGSLNSRFGGMAIISASGIHSPTSISLGVPAPAHGLPRSPYSRTPPAFVSPFDHSLSLPRSSIRSGATIDEVPLTEEAQSARRREVLKASEGDDDDDDQETVDGSDEWNAQHGMAMDMDMDL